MNVVQGLQSVLAVIFAAVVLFTQVSCGDTALCNASNLGDLELEICSNRSFVRVGESVRVRFTVTNFGKQAIVLESKLPVMDIEVRPVFDNQVLTSWSRQNPDKVLHRIEWKPGESKTLELTWTATEETFSRRIFLGGFLSRNLGWGQAANVTICVGYQVCP
jgi:hypothetical protein